MSLWRTPFPCISPYKPRPGTETTDVGFFSLEHLPPLSLGRVIKSDIQAAFAFQDGSMRLTAFD
jgi:hypothetical protein